jgi:hypothetical protein
MQEESEEHIGSRSLSSSQRTAPLIKLNATLFYTNGALSASEARGGAPGARAQHATARLRRWLAGGDLRRRERVNYLG